jgi:hypothetical protein
MNTRLLAAACAAAALAAPAHGQVAGGMATEVPLRVHDGRLYVPVRTAAGAELDFVLSTGTGVTVLSETTARKLGEGAALTLGGQSVPLDGSQTLPDASLVTAGKAFAGMIGANTLNRFDLLIDVPGGKLVLRSPGPSVQWSGVRLSEPVRLQVYHGIALGLEVELNGTKYGALLDLGTAAVLANARAVADAKLSAGPATLRIGETTFTDVSIAETDHPVVRRFAGDDTGFVIVGAHIALDCVLSVSWVHRELRTCVK